MRDGIDRNRIRNSQIERIMVMMLLILFGVSIYTLIISGSNAQSKLMADKIAIESARTAMSYIDVKIRQNDEYGRIFVEQNPINGQNSIVIKAGGCNTWIYWYKDSSWEKGKIFECIQQKDSPVTVGASVEISEADSFSTTYNDKLKTITNMVSYRNDEGSSDNRVKTLTSTLALKTK